MNKLSYALGLNVGNNLQSAGIKKDDIVIADFVDAITAVLNNNDQQITNTEAQQILNDFFDELQKSNESEAQHKESTFLDNNAKRKEVVTTKSGLQYEVLTDGTGARPSSTDKVKCHYEGSLIDGTIFDSSYKRNSPAVFGLNQVIKGWTEALQLMPIGSKWRLYIPYKLGYGEHGAGASIPPYSTLIFDVELLDIVK